MARTTDMPYASPATHGMDEPGMPPPRARTGGNRPMATPEAAFAHLSNGEPGPGPEERSGRDPAHGRSVYNLWIFGLLDRHPADHG